VKPRYLRPTADIPRVFLYRDAVDFRKQSNGLAAIVELELGHNPFDGDLYLFTNRAHKKNKLLGRKRPSFKTTQAAGHVLRSHSLL
jgi:transposase